MKFSELNLSERTLKGLDAMGFVNPTEIQYRSIPVGLEGRDILGQAQTGTGKTAAFGVCILEKTDWEKREGIQHLILAPTRELANQIAEELSQIGRYHPNLLIAVVIGGESYGKQERLLAQHPHIVVSTPGRLIDYIRKGRVTFEHLKTFTLDEVDEMLNVGFYPEVMTIVGKIPKSAAKYMFTATTDKRTDTIANKLLVNPQIIKVSVGHEAKSNIKQMAIVVQEHEKFDSLVNLVMQHAGKQAIVFCRTKHRVKKLTLDLRQLGIKSEMLQGDMSQGARTRALNNFKDKRDQVLIATDVAARGIDIPGIEYVYNYDLPENVEYYTHRIGRTGRAGADGFSYSFVKPVELLELDRLTKFTKSTIERIEPLKGSAHKDKIIAENIKTSVLRMAERSKIDPALVEEIVKMATPEQLAKALFVALQPKSTGAEDREGGFKERRSGGRGGFSRGGGDRPYGGGSRGGFRDRPQGSGSRPYGAGAGAKAGYDRPRPSYDRTKGSYDRPKPSYDRPKTGGFDRGGPRSAADRHFGGRGRGKSTGPQPKNDPNWGEGSEGF